MRGIDISHHNGWPFNAITEKAYNGSDFVIVKATQGTSYKYVSYFRPAIEKALKDEKLIGAYHYAAGGDAVAEADYFISIVKPYLGKIVLALDWEKLQNKSWGDKTWCKRFIDRVKLKTGVKCFLYTGMDGIAQCTNLANAVPLWFAGYPTDANSWTIPKWPSHYRTKPWTHYEIWQFTSSGEKLDRNISNMLLADWMKYASNQPNSTPTTPVNILDLVVNTMKGKYGTGDERKAKLGTYYQEVQDFINHVVTATNETLADEILKGKYGNGDTRKLILGDRYTVVQKIVNEKLK